MTGVLDTMKSNSGNQQYLGVHFITKLHFITKCNKSLLQNAPDFYYKMPQLLQNAKFLTKCLGTIFIVAILFRYEMGNSKSLRIKGH